MRKDRVRSIIIIIRYLPIQEQLIKLTNAQNNCYIDEEEVGYIKEQLNIKEVIGFANFAMQTTTEEETVEDIQKVVREEGKVATTEEIPEQLVLVDTRMLDFAKKYVKSKSFEGRLEKIAEEAKSIEILGEEEYTLEDAKKLKTQLVGLRGSVIALHSDVQLLHDGGKEKITERMRASSETLDIIEGKIKKLSFYILEKTPKVEEVEEEELTPWNKVKKFLGNIRKKFISTESESPRKVQKRFKRVQEKLNEIIESESKEIERLSRDDFLWRDNITEQRRIDIINRTMCGKSYVAKILEGPEEEKNEVIRMLCLEMKSRHQSWLKDPRNPINMGQIVCGREQQSKTTTSRNEGR